MKFGQPYRGNSLLALQKVHDPDAREPVVGQRDLIDPGVVPIKQNTDKKNVEKVGRAEKRPVPRETPAPPPGPTPAPPRRDDELGQRQASPGRSAPSSRGRGIASAAETMHMRQQHDLIELRAKIEQLRAALMEARDAWQEQLDRDEEAAGDDEISQPMLQETRELIARCNAALGQSVSE